jgi:hypothetical protein
MKPAILGHCGHCPADSSHQENGETALAQWQAQLRRLRVLVTQADELTPSAFVKRVHEALPELHQAGMAAVIYTYISSAPKEE